MKNSEGYNDPTAGEAIANIEKKKRNEEMYVKNAISSLMNIFRISASLVGFEIVGRITFRDKITGKEYR